MGAELHGISLGAAYRRWRGSLLGRITDRREAELIDELMGDVQGLHVLDVGCGDDALMASLSLKGANVTGIDPDNAIAEMARVLRPGGQIILGELGRWNVWAVVRRIKGWLGRETTAAGAFIAIKVQKSLIAS